MTPQERRDAETCKQVPCNAQMYVRYVELVWGRAMTTTRVRVFDSTGRDISDEIELRDRKALPGGWSQATIYWVHEGETERIGIHDCGCFTLRDGFTMTETDETLGPRQEV